MMHPAITALLRYFEYQHLPPHLQRISKPCAELAHKMAELPLEGPEVTVGLRKLLEAKDCFVRAALPAAGTPVPPPPEDEEKHPIF